MKKFSPGQILASSNSHRCYSILILIATHWEKSGKIPSVVFFLLVFRFWDISFQSEQYPVTVCSYHVTYAFQSEFTLHICLNVNKFLAQSRREIWSLSGCNWTRTHNHLVHKQTLNHLAKVAKLAKLAKRPVWLSGWVFVYELSSCGFYSSCSHSVPCFFYLKRRCWI